jgi:hypothetical protein
MLMRKTLTGVGLVALAIAISYYFFGSKIRSLIRILPGPDDAPIIIGSDSPDLNVFARAAAKPGRYIHGKNKGSPPVAQDGSGVYFDISGYTAKYIKDEDDKGFQRDLGDGWTIQMTLVNGDDVTLSSSKVGRIDVVADDPPNDIMVAVPDYIQLKSDVDVINFMVVKDASPFTIIPPLHLHHIKP